MRRPASAGGSAARPRRAVRGARQLGEARRRPSTASRRSAISSMPWRASSRSQAPSASRRCRPRAYAGEQGVALREGARVRRACRRRAPARARPRAGRDAPGGPPGAPLTSSSRSGRNTLTGGRASRPGGPSSGLPSSAIRLGSPGSNPTSSRCDALVVGQVERDPGDRGAAADQLALVGGARGAAGAAEVDGLEQVRLAGAVGPADHRQPVGQLDRSPLVVAELAQPRRARRARPRLHVQANRHHEVAKAGAVVTRLDEARDGVG